MSTTDPDPRSGTGADSSTGSGSGAPATPTDGNAPRGVTHDGGAASGSASAGAQGSPADTAGSAGSGSVSVGAAGRTSASSAAPNKAEKPARPATRSTRRQFLLGGAVAGAGAVAAIGVDLAVNAGARWGQAHPTGTAGADGQTAVNHYSFNGPAREPFFGAHQAGVETHPAQAHAIFVALDLNPGSNRNALKRMMTILTGDAVSLTQGQAPLADLEVELVDQPARLTVTFGFGPGFVTAAGGQLPSWLHPLQAFSIDQLQSSFSDGDLLIQVCGDDPIAVSHAVRMLLTDARSFATHRWTQQGFRRAWGTVPANTTMRNLFGQVDGTVNPVPNTTDFDKVVWSSGGWMTGGTSMVLRRIRFDMDAWDILDRMSRENAVGRKLSNGAPLTGTYEDEDPDYAAKDAEGFPVIPDYCHMRRAHGTDGADRILRRGYNYDDSPTGGAISDTGLLFVAYQADVDAQFLPIQKRLDEEDILNRWTTPIGSAVFAIPPGCTESGFIGDTLLS